MKRTQSEILLELKECLIGEREQETEEALIFIKELSKFRLKYFSSGGFRPNFNMSEVKEYKNIDLRIILKKCYQMIHELDMLKKENISLKAENQDLLDIKEKIQEFNT